MAETRGAVGRRATNRKGDLREQSILDTAEELLSSAGYDAMTVGDIATGAGITRGALYFYFGSKDEVVTALVARTVRHLWDRSEVAARSDEPREAITAAMRRTVELWREHGLIIRTAIDMSLAVPEIGDLWRTTADRFIAAIHAVLVRAGVPDGNEPDHAPALARTLCWMIERSFYHAWASGDLEHAAASCEHIWMITAGLDR